MMVNFYIAIIESILPSSITLWYAAATAKDQARLRRIIRSPEKVMQLQPALSTGPACLQDSEACS